MGELEYRIQNTSDIQGEDEQEYQSRINLTQEQELDIINRIEANLEYIEKQRKEDGCESRWAQYDNLYWGIVRQNPNTTFNLHQFLTLTRVRRVKSRLFQAFFESDPIFSVSPRPRYAKKGGYEAAEKQEQFLDYEFDSEIIIHSPVRKAFHEATLKDGGIVKLIWERDYEWKRVREKYPGTKKGLNDFLEAYPDAREKHLSFVKDLEEGHDIDIVVDKKEIVYDAPRFYHVPFKNFYIDLNTEGLLGLRKARFFAELQNYTWHELQEEVEEGRFDKDKVELLQWSVSADGQVSLRPNYEDENYDIYECNLFYDIKGNGKPKRIVVWYSRERKVILSAIHFPYEHGRPYYIPFFIVEEEPGWHQPGLARILMPANIIANSITNFLLDNAFYRNTPLLRVSPNSTIAQQLLAKAWKIGDPLVAERGEVEAFELNRGNLLELVTLLQMNERHADDSSGGSIGYMSGRADPTDPKAPATKALALLRETNINIKDFILTLVPSFQEMAYQILQLFAQFCDRAEYKARKTVGKEVFKEISPEELRLRTNITPNAMAFSFDKLNEKRENLALAEFLTTNPMAQQFLARAPMAQWTLFHILIKSWSNKWNQKVDEVWPTKEQVDEYLAKIQEKAFENFYQRKVSEFQKQAQRTANPPQGPAPNAPVPNNSAVLTPEERGGVV